MKNEILKELDYNDALDAFGDADRTVIQQIIISFNLNEEVFIFGDYLNNPKKSKRIDIFGLVDDQNELYNKRTLFETLSRFSNLFDGNYIVEDRTGTYGGIFAREYSFDPKKKLFIKPRQVNLGLDLHENLDNIIKKLNARNRK